MTSNRPVAVVTGAGRGIGRAIALELAGIGFDLALPLLDPTDAESQQVEADARAAGATVRLFTFDLADVEGHPSIAKAIAAAFGRLDCLVNNAGIGSPRRGDLMDLTPDAFDTVIGVNLRGTLFFTQACVREMLVLGGAGHPRSVVTISSVSAEMASPERTDYCISKAGLSMALKNLALRLAGDGIAVFEVRPGIIRTPMTAPVSARYDARIADGLSLIHI